jgi:cytochrome c-type protein NapC
MTNTLEFCVSCHEMRDTVYQEYKTSIHYSNRSGVRAICSDCHVPKDWGHKMLRKAKASFEVWGKLTGSIDTPEKFEAKRITLATHEWERMKESDSRECRNCHNFEAMSADYQKKSNYARHMKAKDAGKTCIDCHKGIAHQLPKEYEEPEDED